MDVAGDFIYTAALLIHIKSKMLLPRTPVETLDGEENDPRRELVERLLEHERFKNAAQMLTQSSRLRKPPGPIPASGSFAMLRGRSRRSLPTQWTWCVSSGKYWNA